MKKSDMNLKALRLRDNEDMVEKFLSHIWVTISAGHEFSQAKVINDFVDWMKLEKLFRCHKGSRTIRRL